VVAAAQQAELPKSEMPKKKAMRFANNGEDEGPKSKKEKVKAKPDQVKSNTKPAGGSPKEPWKWSGCIMVLLLCLNWRQSNVVEFGDTQAK